MPNYNLPDFKNWLSSQPEWPEWAKRVDWSCVFEYLDNGEKNLQPGTSTCWKWADLADLDSDLNQNLPLITTNPIRKYLQAVDEKRQNQELKEKMKEGIKPSDLKKLKRSKSADEMVASLSANPPLPRSKSQLEIPLLNEPSPTEQIKQLQGQVKFHAQTSQNYLQNLQLAQAKITELEEKAKQDNKLKEKITNLEEQILQLRLDKITEFGDYLERKEELSQELADNIKVGVQEIKRLENQLLTTNKKKLELQQKLAQSHHKNAQLELKLIEELKTEPSFNAWPLLTIMVSLGLALWLFNQPE